MKNKAVDAMAALGAGAVITLGLCVAMVAAIVVLTNLLDYVL